MQVDHLRDHAREVWDEARESTEARQQGRAQREADDAEARS